MSSYFRTFLFVIMILIIPSAFAENIDIISLLHNNDTNQLEKSLNEAQLRFENGDLTEYELRNTFRPFYSVDALAEKNLQGWVVSSPKSYVAHLALGIYYKRLGDAVRGHKYMSATPQKNIDEMTRYFNLSEDELRQSLGLTKKPYLSIFHLLQITGNIRDQRYSEALLSLANTYLPSNALVRDRYAVYLLPRWGGSYEAFEDFIDRSKRDGAPNSVLLQLQAIEDDDKGFVLEKQGEHDAAIEKFRQALQLGQTVGGTFSTEYLSTSSYYMATKH